MAKSAKEHTCYFCGDSEETVLVPICKGCLDAFNKYVEEVMLKEDQHGNQDNL